MQGAARLERAGLVALTIAVFGPYVTLGPVPVRSEQIAVYGGFALMLVLAVMGRTQLPPLTRPGRTLVLLLLALPATLVLSVIAASVTSNRPDFVSIIAALDSQLMPVLVVLLVAWLARPLSPGSPHLTIVARTLVVCLTVNSLVILIQILTGSSSWLRAFWAPAGGGQTVAELALGNGRYTGVVNQPAEAGLLYGIGLIGLVWACGWPRTWTVLAALAAGFGGLASGSKVFLVAAAVTLVLLLVRPGTWRARLTQVLGLSVVLALAGGLLIVSSSLSPTPSQVAGLGQLGGVVGGGVATTPSDGQPPTLLERIVYRATAGRFGPGGTLTNAFDWSSPVQAVFGPGPGKKDERPAFDSAWVEVFILGGFLGVLALLAVMLQLGRLSRWSRSIPRYVLMAPALFLTVLFASTGFGSLTANRTTTVFWTVFTLLAVAALPSTSKKQAEQLDADLADRQPAT